MAEDFEDYINRLNSALEEIIQGADHKLQVASQKIFEIELQLESERANNKNLQKKLSQVTDSKNHVPDEQVQVASQKIIEIELQLKRERSKNKKLQKKLSQVTNSENHVPDEQLQKQINGYQVIEKKLQREIVTLKSELDSVLSSKNKDREDLQSVLTEFKGMLDQI